MEFVEGHDVNKRWLTELPHSQMVYPDALRNRIKYVFWRMYAPYHPAVRDGALAVGLVRHEGRQRYLLGTIAPHLTIQQFVAHLVERGYGNHFVAWKEEGEVASLRAVQDFVYQYHIRVYADREVRGHYEYTPECHPIAHVRETFLEERRDYFLALLGNTVTLYQTGQ